MLIHPLLSPSTILSIMASTVEVDSIWGMAAIINSDSQISSIDFHADGQYCVSTTKEGSVQLIDSLSGEEKKKLYTKTHGIGSVKYTHHEACVLLSSERKTHDIRYLCMHDNRYLRFFKGHSDKVTSLSMSPISDYFISSSNDKTVLVWNLEYPSPIARLQLPAEIQNPFVAYDASGLVFGVMGKDSRLRENTLKLFDARNYDKGPFDEIAPRKEMLAEVLSPNQARLDATWTDFNFSPDGNKVLVNTNADFCFLLDGFSREEKPILISNRKNETGLTLGACYSPDGTKVYVGNEDSEIQIYDASNGQLLSYLTGHVTPVRSVKCNPKYEVIASGCLNNVLWLKR